MGNGYGPDDRFGRPAGPPVITTSPASLRRATGTTDPDYRGPFSYAEGGRWGAVPPIPGRRYPVPPPSNLVRPYTETTIPGLPEALNENVWGSEDTTIDVQSSIALDAFGAFLPVVSIDLRTAQRGFELVLQWMGGELVTPVVGAANSELLTWRLAVNGIVRPFIPDWTGSWQPVQNPRRIFVRVPGQSIVTLEVMAPAGFPVQNSAKGMLAGKSRLLARPGAISAGHLRS